MYAPRHRPRACTLVAPLMRAAGHDDFRRFGLHCFRVGGVVAMQEAGASMPEVMAQGRWKSDVVRIYCRRGKERSMRWGQRIMRRSPGMVRRLGRRASEPLRVSRQWGGVLVG